MSFTLAVVVFVVAIILAVLIHEAGHLLVAKIFDFKVEEYFVGFGPKLWSFKRGETEYGVKAIPAGGYVKIAGMNPYQPPAEEDLPRAYGAKPRWQRALVIFAGPLTHVIVAYVLFVLFLGFVGAEVSGVIINRVEPLMDGVTSPAAAAGLKAGDVIVRVGDVRDPSVDALSAYTRTHLDEPITLGIRRGDREFSVTVTPVMGPGVGDKRQPRIGFIVSDTIVARDRKGLVGSLAGGAGMVGTGVTETVRGIAKVFGPDGIGRIFKLLFGGGKRQPTDATSIIGIARFAGQTATTFGYGELLRVLAAINLFIGLINLIPLPPFDGGHLAVLVIEKIRGRSVDMRKLVPVSAVVLSVLVLFTMAAMYLDIVKPFEFLP